jgi:hypothetical protein
MKFGTGAESIQSSDMYTVRFSPYRVKTYDSAHRSYTGRTTEAKPRGEFVLASYCIPLEKCSKFALLNSYRLAPTRSD